MNTITDGAQLKTLSEKCSNNKNELTKISTVINKELNHLTQEIKTHVETANDNVLVIYINIVLLKKTKLNIKF